MTSGVDRPARSSWVVTAIFPDRDATESAVSAALRAGLPRDRVDVVVTPAVAEREFGDVRPRPRHRAVASAAVGGLIGLVIGILVALVLVLLPGYHDPGGLAFAQLLGPNVTTLGGAVVGAVIGFFRRGPQPPHHERVDQAPDGVLVTVSARSEEEVEILARLLDDAGGDPRVEAVE